MVKSIMFFLILTIVGGTILRKTTFRRYGTKEFFIIFGKAILGCAFCFALPWILEIFFLALSNL